MLCQLIVNKENPPCTLLIRQIILLQPFDAFGEHMAVEVEADFVDNIYINAIVIKLLEIVSGFGSFLT